MSYKLATLEVAEYMANQRRNNVHAYGDIIQRNESKNKKNKRLTFPAPPAFISELYHVLK